MTQSNGPTPKPAGKRPALIPCGQHPIRVALVEDQTKARENWIRLINSFPDFNCVSSCISAEKALTIIPAKHADVVLMDIFLPRMSGIECLSRLKAKLPEVQIVILTAMDNQELLFMALKAGADGYLFKRTKPSDLRKALLDMLIGGVPITSQIARWLIESFRESPQNKETLKAERLSCYDVVNKQVRLQLLVLAYNLGNFLRQAVLCKRCVTGH
jgi:DNA-binding NarL/FixJ family response regulator